MPRCHATNKSQVAPSSVIGTIATLGIIKSLTNIGFTEMASFIARDGKIFSDAMAKMAVLFHLAKEGGANASWVIKKNPSHAP